LNLKAKDIIFKVKIGVDQPPFTIWMLGPLRVNQYFIGVVVQKFAHCCAMLCLE
jgi:hypothetical protein